jgi:hypothetical protein
MTARTTTMVSLNLLIRITAPILVEQLSIHSHKWSVGFTARLASAYGTRSSPPSRRSDSRAAKPRPALSTRCGHRKPSHFAWCHPDTRTACLPRDIERGSPAR